MGSYEKSGGTGERPMKPKPNIRPPAQRPAVLNTGVNGTDNCPACGKTMRKRRIAGWLLTCAGKNHTVSYLIEDEQPRNRPPV